ncbi:MAG: PilZ domain-containing protein [Candidatus Marinimicrobia bacterium]|nr:PilZ domain-containing protein [Candidatus Neomarinimicrobiota bacterium]
MKNRKYKRWHISKSLRIVDSKSNQSLGSIRNISSKGMGIICKEPLTPDKNFNLKIVLTGDDFTEEKDIEIEARTIWCQKTENKHYLAGLKFENLNISNEIRIKTLILRMGHSA